MSGTIPAPRNGVKFYEEFLDQLALGAYRTTPDGRFEYANLALAELLGYPSVEKLKEDTAEHIYVDLEDRREWQKQIDSAVNGKLVCFKTQLRRLDGRVIRVKDSARTVRENGTVVAYEGIVTDITEQLAPLELIVAPGGVHRNALWSDVVKQHLPICISRKDRQRRVVWANEAFCRLEGVTLDELLNQKNTDALLYGSELDELYRVGDEKVFETGQAYITTERHRSGDKLMRTVQVVKLPIFGEDGRTVEGVEVFFWDAADPLQPMAELERARQRAERFERLLRSQYSASYEHDLNGYFRKVNEATEELTGRTQEEWAGLHISNVVAPEYLEFAQARIQEKLSNPKPAEHVTSYELEILHKDGRRIPVEITSRLLMDRGKPTGILGYVRDLTRRREAEQSRLREIHHRVKNNLHTVNGLLENAARTANEETRETLVACRQRVLAIAQIHEQLYRAPHLDKIDARKYVQDLTDRLFRTYQGTWQRITPRVNVDSTIYLSLDALTPCALVLHELISNALKHAFPPKADKASGERYGTVFVSLNLRDGNRYRLQVADTGIGMPPGFDREKSRSLGMSLIYGLIETQLKGTVSLDTGPAGTLFSAVFSDPAASGTGDAKQK